jgi:hypothetical protein
MHTVAISTHKKARNRLISIDYFGKSIKKCYKDTTFSQKKSTFAWNIEKKG